jgi:protein arginine N-methyltransferase 5
LYEDAIAAAIMSKQPEETKEKLVVMILGAGRGPIVKAAMHASKKTNRPINLYAVEKNRNAVNTLLHLQRSSWKEMGFDVTVVHSDMRKFNPPVKGDIIVSELLGSFGDNELSPECLDGAQRYLQNDGIMIPQNYTSFVHPIMSAKLHTEVRSLPEKNSKTDAAHYQTPYVVHMKNKYDIAPPQKLFEYHHPNRIPHDTNDRCQQLDFEAKADCVLSGFAGYFESELFGGVMMSILPATYTEGMLSWFPIYFPIKNPVQIKEGDKISVRFRRCSTERSVWYEWNVTSPVIVSTHNLNGCAYEIGL